MRRIRIGTLEGPAKPAVVHVGSWQKPVPCRFSPDGQGLALPAEALAETGLLAGDEVLAFSPDDGQHIYLGPLVGILLGPQDLPLLHGSRSERYSQMLREARAAGAFAFLFEIENVDGQSRGIGGWVRRAETWAPAYLPFPDVIYHRDTYPTPGERLRAADVRRKLRLAGVTFLNSANSFSKWEVYDALRFYAETAALVPETVWFDSQTALAEMLQRHPRVFVKADQGSHGSEVLRIREVPGGWQVQGRFGRRRIDETFPNLEILYGFLSLLRGQARWVIQQGIDLPRVAGRIFDLRVIVQKDGTGRWQAPLLLVRWAQEGQVAANMSQGGEPFLPGAFLERFGPELAGLEAMETTAVAAAMQTAAALESRYGLLGEIGVDIGLDRQGRAWVFEANTKPLHPEIPDLPVPLIRYPFHYAIYLAQRAWAGRQTGLAWPRLPG